MENFPEQSESIEQAYSLTVMERIRNFGDGAVAKFAVAAAFVSGGVATEMAIDATPVAADTAPTGTLTTDTTPNTTPLTDNEKQQCINSLLDEPVTKQKLTMRHAGIRPLDPHHFYTQSTQGIYEYRGAEGCSPEENLIVKTQIEMQNQTHRKVWMKNGIRSTGYVGDKAGEAAAYFSPNHAWPNFLFNECTPGKGFQKIRVVLTNIVRNGETHKIDGKQSYTEPGVVKGNCAAAKRSEQATKGIKNNWG